MFVINNLTKSFGDKLLFKNVNLTIYDGEKIGIVGANGTGKSTFMKILAQELKPDEGTVYFKGNLACVKQVLNSEEAKNFSSDIVSVLKTSSQIKLDGERMFGNFDTLSGGEQTKLMISQALSKDADTLLLDEPTNNLDMTSIEWLIQRLKSYRGTVVVVSHDRYFLDKVADKILEFENGEICEYFGGYTEYALQKQEKLDYATKIYQKKLNENKKLQEQIERLSNLTDKLERATKNDGSADRRAKGYKTSAQAKVKKVAKQAEAKYAPACLILRKLRPRRRIWRTFSRPLKCPEYCGIFLRCPAIRS